MLRWSDQRWIENVLSNFDENVETQIEGDQEPLTCKVYSVKVLEEPVDGVGGVMEVHDSRLYIKALFTVNAVTSFNESEKNATTVEFTGLWNSIIVFKRYRITVDVAEKIENSDIAVCVDDFALVAHKLSPSIRRVPLLSVLAHPKVIQDLWRIWRAKYALVAPTDPDTHSSESEYDTQMSGISKLVEVLEASEPESYYWPCCGGPYIMRTPDMKAVLELDLNNPEVQKLNLNTQEALKLAILDIQHSQINAPIAWTRHDECPRSGENFIIMDLPTDQTLYTPVVTLSAPEIPESEMEKLQAIEMQPEYVQQGSLESGASSSNEVISFLTEPSLQADAQEGTQKEMILQADHSRPKRKLSFDLTNDRSGKVARNSGINNTDVAEIESGNAAQGTLQQDPPKKTADRKLPDKEAPAYQKVMKGTEDAAGKQGSKVSEENLLRQECLIVPKDSQDCTPNLVHLNDKATKQTDCLELCISKVAHKMSAGNLQDQGHSEVSTDQVGMFDGESSDQKETRCTKATTRKIVGVLPDLNKSVVTEDLPEKHEGADPDSCHSMDLEESPDRNIPQNEGSEFLPKLGAQAGSKEIPSQVMEVDEQIHYKNSACSSQEDPLKVLCDCLTPAEYKTDEEFQTPHDQSAVSDLDSSDTFLSLSCEVGNGIIKEKDDQSTEGLVPLLPNENWELNSKSASTPQEKDAVLESNASHPVLDSEVTYSNCSKISQDGTGTPQLATDQVSQAISNLTRVSHKLTKTSYDSSNSIHVTINQHQKLSDDSNVQPDIVEVNNNSKHSNVEVWKNQTGKPAQDPAQEEVGQSLADSTACHSQSTKIAKTCNRGLLSPVSIKPLTRKRMASDQQSTDERGHHSVTCLRSPTVFKSIPTPVHSLTSHQPPKMRLSEASESSNTSTTESGSSSSECEDIDRSTRLSNFKVEDHILDWCLSYLSNLTPPKQ